jgi:hypothetical protein
MIAELPGCRAVVSTEFGVSAPQITTVVAPSSSSIPSRAVPTRALFAFVPMTASPSSGAAQSRNDDPNHGAHKERQAR